MMGILVQAEAGSSCLPLLRRKRPKVSSPLLLTCRRGWVGWEAQGGTEGMRHPRSHGCTPWTEAEGSLCSCAYVFFSAALPNESFTISSTALQGVPSAMLTSTQGLVAHEGCKLSSAAACLSPSEGSSKLSGADAAFGRESFNQNKSLIETGSIPATVVGFCSLCFPQ